MANQDVVATPEQYPSTINVKFDQFPEAKNWTLGEEVEITIKGKVTSLRAPDRYMKGEATVETSNGSISEKELMDMPLNKLRDKLPKKDENA